MKTIKPSVGSEGTFHRNSKPKEKKIYHYNPTPTKDKHKSFNPGVQLEEHHSVKIKFEYVCL